MNPEAGFLTAFVLCVLIIAGLWADVFHTATVLLCNALGIG